MSDKTAPLAAEKIPIGISACLLGEEVRYNGGHKRDAYINGTLSQFFSFRSFCPEVGAGLSVPREPVRLVECDGDIRVVGTKDNSVDVTAPLEAYSEAQLPNMTDLYGFIFKRASPSCGMERVKVYNQKNMPHPEGQGVFAKAVMGRYKNLPVEEEGRLGDPSLRENFIQRVFAYYRWQCMCQLGITVQGLMTFHAQHKLMFMSHDQDSSRQLGKIVASVTGDNLQQIATDYIQLAMQTLKKVATRKNHVNVLQHIQGYLKKQLDSDDKQELLDVFDRYKQGDLPLIVPITLLKHHFRKMPDDYIAQSWYMQPYPQELKLRNLL